MNLYNYYWWFKSALPLKLCDDIIKFALIKQEELAITGGFDNKKLTEKDIKKLKEKRYSHIVWLDENWIYKEITPVVQQANKDARWNYDWDRMEQAQFTKYGKGQYYKWHMDSTNKPFDNPEELFLHKKIRKLSLSLLLSYPDEYKGGDFEFDFSNVEAGTVRHPLKELCGKGSMVVFPSDTFHRVTPVTEGTRYSLVIWCSGDPFR